MDFGLKVLLVLLLLGVALVQGQDKSHGGSISLNCGGVGYYESRRGVTYVPDEAYISSGLTRSISHEFQKPNLPRHLWDLRSFPEGNRNCFYFNFTKGDKYLIRAEFFYGNYDGLDNPLEFDVHVGSVYHVRVSFPPDSSPALYNMEVIHELQSKHLDLCVAKTASSVPFVSSLELRLIQKGAYNVRAGLLEPLHRFDFGSTSDDADFRDRFGRHWEPVNNDSSLTPIKTKEFVDTSLIAEDPPEASMKTAVIPTSIDHSTLLFTMNMMVSPYDDDEENIKLIYFYMYFAEVYELKDGETREFTIFKNGHIWQRSYSPTYLKARVKIGYYTMLSNETLEFKLVKTSRSTLPPLFNALEVYLFHPFSGKDTAAEDVTAVRNIKNYYTLNKLNWEGDPCSPPTYMWDGVKCDYDLYSIPTIISLNLSSKRLVGVLTPNIFYIRKLAVLDLSNNNLTGTIPEFLSQMHELKVINLRGNKFSGTVPQGLFEKSSQGLLQLSVEENPNLCLSGHCNPPDDPNKHLLAIFASVASSVVLILAIFRLVYFLKKRKNSPGTDNAVPVMDPNPNHPYHSDLAMQREFQHGEIERITDGFAKIIGRGGFGCVFYGVLETQDVAIKVLDRGSYQQFIAEVTVLLRVHHRNLVKLIGYCREADCVALVYEFMANGDLKDHLSGKFGRFLSNPRLKIATQVAQGLEYLHHGCNPPIIHRDVKTRNILLDEHFEAKLGDFGLSKSLPTDEGTHVSTSVAGTYGYMDPEYLTSNRLTDKSDVYGFGVVLLELITNQSANDKSRESPLIADWVNYMVAKGETADIIDPQLFGQFHTKSLHDAIDLAIACVNEVSGDRPGMDRVALGLNDCLALEMARVQEVYFSQSSISAR